MEARLAWNTRFVDVFGEAMTCGKRMLGRLHYTVAYNETITSQHVFEARVTQSTLVGSVRTSLCHASSFRCPAVKYVSRSWQRFLAVVRGRGSWHWVLSVVLGSGSFAVVVCSGSSHCLRLSRLRGLQGSMPQFSDTCAFTPSIDCRQADNRSFPRDITWAPFQP